MDIAFKNLSACTHISSFLATSSRLRGSGDIFCGSRVLWGRLEGSLGVLGSSSLRTRPLALAFGSAAVNFFFKTLSEIWRLSLNSNFSKMSIFGVEGLELAEWVLRIGCFGCFVGHGWIAAFKLEFSGWYVLGNLTLTFLPLPETLFSFSNFFLFSRSLFLYETGFQGQVYASRRVHR